MSDEKLLKEDDVELFEKDDWVDGFNWKTLAGCLFVGTVMMPGAIYLGLVTGQSLAGAAEWVTIILFIEIAKRSFVKLKRQEIIMIYGMAAGMLMMGIRLGVGAQIFGGPLGNVIWDQFFVNSPQAAEFADQLPRWFAPPPGHASYIKRTFFDMAWALPLTVLGIHMLLSWTQGLAGAYVLYRIVNDIERLPFPMSRVHAGGATALAESSSKSETWRWRLFSIGAMVGLMFGLLYVTLPSITGALLPNAIMILPIPFIDFTAEINQFIPAAALGISTTIGPILAGFVLPFWAVVGGFLGAMCCWFILNPILYANGLLPSWQKGMSIIPTSIALRVDYYISQGIGIAAVICLLGIIAIWRAGMKSEFEKQDRLDLEDLKGRGQFPIWASAAIWFGCLAIYVILCRFLVPEFPTWIIVLFAFVFTPLNSYLTARMIAMTGTGRGATFPFIKEGALLLSGYRGVTIWFAPLPLFNVGHGVDGFKQAELTRTKFVSKVKGSVYGLLLLSVFSVFFWAIIWKMAPIPSGSYPFVQRMWPLYAQMQALWVKTLMERGGELSQFEDGRVGDETALNNFESLIENFPKSCTSLVDDGKGHLYAAVVNKGLRIFDQDTRRWYRIVPQVFVDKGFIRAGEGVELLTLPAKTVFDIKLGPDGKLYMGSDNGLLILEKFAPEGLIWKQFRLNGKGDIAEEASLRMENILLQTKGTAVTGVWFSLFPGVGLIDPASAVIQNGKVADFKVALYKSTDTGVGKKVGLLLQQKTGRILIGTNKGMAAFENGKWHKLGEDIYTEINALYPEGDTVYAGTDDGAYLIKGDTVTAFPALAGMDVVDFARSRDLYAVTYNNGLAILKQGAQTFELQSHIDVKLEDTVVQEPLQRLNGIDFLTIKGKPHTFVTSELGLYHNEGAAPGESTRLSRKDGGLIETNTDYVMQASNGDVWIVSNQVKSFLLRGINPYYIMWSAIGALAFYFICIMLKVPLLFFYGAAGAAAGAVGAWPHTQIPLFAGALLGRYYFARRFGAKKWRNFAPVLLAGFACGMGLVGMSSIGISLIIKAVNTLVY
ncbi:hypothetical protein ACFL4W_00825 [Planctomycetota bacterium]